MILAKKIAENPISASFVMIPVHVNTIERLFVRICIMRLMPDITFGSKHLCTFNAFKAFLARPNVSANVAEE